MEYSPDDLDRKLSAAFDGKVVRKDLLHRIKKGTNVPTFVLEFLLARYCASNDPDDVNRALGLGPGLPTQYVLQPGDERLWAGMTAPQRERALLFLQDGSTIASSLKPD